MAPSVVMMAQDHSNEPVSRTFQYRKYMKPMLERKRRARINRCLDELKELMTGALQNGDCDNVTKLEKADILELTVRHLHNLRRQNKLYATANVTYADRFRAGFTHCAAEVSQFLNKIDHNANAHLMRHLRDCIQRCEPVAPPPPPAPPVLRLSSPPVPMDYYPANGLVPTGATLKLNQKVIAVDGNGNNTNYLSGYGRSSPADHSDTRPVLIKRSVSPTSSTDDSKDEEDPQQGDVWRPW